MAVMKMRLKCKTRERNRREDDRRQESVRGTTAMKWSMSTRITMMSDGSGVILVRDRLSLGMLCWILIRSISVHVPPSFEAILLVRHMFRPRDVICQKACNGSRSQIQMTRHARQSPCSWRHASRHRSKPATGKSGIWILSMVVVR